MKQLTVRNVTLELAAALDEERKSRGGSLNQTVLELLAHTLGVSPASRYDNGLGSLAGTWSEEEAQEFDDNTAVFGGIDEELWQ